VIVPLSIEKDASRAAMTGTMPLVVQEAADTMRCSGARVSSLTPNTIVASTSGSAGWENSTRPAPAARCSFGRGAVREGAGALEDEIDIQRRTSPGPPISGCNAAAAFREHRPAAR
jgi:hypothetical protein